MTENPTAAGDVVPPQRYTAALAEQIEKRWQDQWDAEGTFNVPNPVGPLSDGFDAVAERPRAFVMDMFPYPSGAGLHVGHPLGYIGTDTYTRYLRMRGENVLYTMGFDAFGLPAEQYAVQTGQHPRVTTYANIAEFRRQLRRLGMGHDVRRSIATTDPECYRWTQWIFCKIFESWYDRDADRARPITELIAELDADARHPSEGTNPFGLPWAAVVRNAAPPGDRQPSAGLSRRGRRQLVPRAGHRAGRRGGHRRRTQRARQLPGLPQAAGAVDDAHDRLRRPAGPRPGPDRLAGQRPRHAAQLDRQVERRARAVPVAGGGHRGVHHPAGHPVRGHVHGAGAGASAGRRADGQVWPDGAKPAWTGGHATPVEAVAAYRKTTAGHSELERQAGAAKEKTGVFIGSFATNPVTGAAIPVFIADYVLRGYGTGAIMAVPGQDERDWEFAEAFELPIVRTVQPPDGFDGTAYAGEGRAINSGFLDGKHVAEAKSAIVAWLEEYGHGRGAITFRLRDWLFSRQRYWGEPFPIVYDEHDLPVALPESMLPLELPETNDFSPRLYAPDDADSEPEPPLGRLTDWVNVTLDLGDGPKRYRRETNTMPNWAGSCWYELRYLDPTNDLALVDPEIERYWMGPTADRPAGGVGLYVGGVEHAVLHLLYARFWHKVLFDLGYLSSAEPYHRLINQGYLQLPAYTNADGFYVEAAEVEERDGEFYFHGERVKREFGKIGKSLKNVITPDQFIAEWGTDTFRLFEMFGGPLEQSRPWDTKAIVGPFRLLQRVWRVVIDETTGAAHVSAEDVPDDLNRLLHKTIAAVREGFETLRFNTSIARITELTNALTLRYPHGGAPRSVAEPLVLMLAPLAPHAAEELWLRLGHDTSLAWEQFPAADPALLVDETIELPVQVNGKVRAVLTVPAASDRDALETAARADERVAAVLDGRPVKRVVVVPGRLVNLVV